MIKPITPQLHHYAWGSTTSIPEILGIEVTDEPVAEAWFGELAEVVTPDGAVQTLGEMIASDPLSALGHARLDDLRHALPYLVKFLAAGWPLSIQVHPPVEAARPGFERENALGIPVDHPSRTYRDPNGKPEVILALEHFEMLAGFRDPLESAAFIDALGIPALRQTAEVLRSGGAQALRQAVTDLYALDVDAVMTIVEQVAHACANEPPGPHERVCFWVGNLANEFPHDVGVVIAMLMNHVVLERFDLAFVDVGIVHSYLSGLGLEVMGNSDNVVRGGLTIKHVDGLELLRLLNFEPGLPYLVRSSERTLAADRFSVPTDRFELSLVELEADVLELEVDGPEILVVLEGAATVEQIDPGEAIELPTGAAAFIGAATDRYRIKGRGMLARIAPGPAGQTGETGESQLP